MAAASSLSSLLVSSMALTSPIFQSHCLNNTTCKRGTTMAVSLQTANKPVIHQEKPANKRRRVVVTGIGLVTALGEDPDVFYNNVLQGISGITEIEKFDTSQLPSLAMRADNFMLYLITAGKKALADGGISDEVNVQLDKTRCGIIVGSAMGGLRNRIYSKSTQKDLDADSTRKPRINSVLTGVNGARAPSLDDVVMVLEHSWSQMIFYEWFENMLILSRRPNPFSVPMAGNNMGCAALAIELGWMGPNYIINAGCATSNHCILSAAGHITDGITVWQVSRHAKLCLRGTVTRPKLHRRGARIYAEFLGGSSTADAYHLTRPHPDGIVRCIEKALAKAGVAREDVNYINAHAPSTQVGDLIEFAALVRCFGNNMELRINSTKSMTGHLAGATGAVDAIATIKDMNLLVGSKKERLNIKVGLSNSFTLGGQNSSILFAPLQSE
ncbi:hypothetical protein CXB51_022532 [Gossypium anomalum]|uniref:beta-ketoacyl-[acyl-carrier-protein] synthase I n=1 Tax=Gossypium anomalum TaxID=47600 RepID=A0A8J5Y5S4_9ROSI|nr:hypothetical protein CXB51_022532 [Gossypium anomalum]